jgi:hypothetical protein
MKACKKEMEEEEEEEEGGAEGTKDASDRQMDGAGRGCAAVGFRGVGRR